MQARSLKYITEEDSKLKIKSFKSLVWKNKKYTHIYKKPVQDLSFIDKQWYCFLALNSTVVRKKRKKSKVHGSD